MVWNREVLARQLSLPSPRSSEIQNYKPFNISPIVILDSIQTIFTYSKLPNLHLLKTALFQMISIYSRVLYFFRRASLDLENSGGRYQSCMSHIYDSYFEVKLSLMSKCHIWQKLPSYDDQITMATLITCINHLVQKIVILNGPWTVFASGPFLTRTSRSARSLFGRTDDVTLWFTCKVMFV